MIIGTRPEAIKLSPVAKALAELGITPRIVLTGQHPNLEIEGFDLCGFPLAELGCPAQTDPHRHVASVARCLCPAVEGTRLVVVQGDTSSALGGALGASMAGLPVAMSRLACAVTIPVIPGQKRTSGWRSMPLLTYYSRRPS